MARQRRTHRQPGSPEPRRRTSPHKHASPPVPTGALATAASLGNRALRTVASGRLGPRLIQRQYASLAAVNPANVSANTGLLSAQEVYNLAGATVGSPYMIWGANGSPVLYQDGHDGPFYAPIVTGKNDTVANTPPNAHWVRLKANGEVDGFLDNAGNAVGVAAPKPPTIKQRRGKASGFTNLAKKKAKVLADLLDAKVDTKGGLDVAASPRKVDSWIKVTVQDFDDGPRVDLEEHKPEGEIPDFVRVRIQGNSGATFGGLLLQIGKSYTAAQLKNAMRDSLVNGHYTVLYDEADEKNLKMPPQ